ncbi:glycosyltransferase family 4 protein [Methanohalophilus sp. DAL1]|uniref:glycosyltransferase family 4 protein n=1 Tax=Methanohalophilus sp. DAL1 TaxID=1864608 RepID=UPI0008180A16|nr:glycosyltransferase family 4 protein [Methanohalophilus sp. DAL1]OBZ34280.1 MAG: glycosyl transferase [Methanohalophilus sp. DAL1]
MKIAIVAPSPVPFNIGGAEKLWWGLQNYINEHTTHQCELFKIPTREHNFWDLIDSYYLFYKLDLSYFDVVISTKYPAWMVKHKNHTVYLQHHLRGLFDTYHFCNESMVVPQNLRVGLVKNILEIIDADDLSEDNTNNIFKILNQLKIEQQNYDNETFKFPGPFIRKIIHYFDAYALASDRIYKYFAISENVKLRKDYFPQSAEVSVVYHPSKIEKFECNDYDYLFTASRLDSSKRINLLVEAMKYVQYDIKFKIAGTGPEEKRLKELAKGDARIEFIGYTSEEDLVNLYSNALMILYIPFDEDYGLITIEGMMSHKPILTAIDSGGSLEFVNNYDTGFAVEPNPLKIAEKINYIIENREEAIKMGNLAYRKVEDINWNNVASQLLNDKQLIPKVKKKVLVLSTYSCYPPRGGGQHRLYNIYSLLAKDFDVTICSIIEANKPYQDLILKNGLKQICVPQSREHAEAQWEVEHKLKRNLYDVCMIDFVKKSEKYVHKVKNLSKDADIIIFSHPYLYNLEKYIKNNKLMIYDAIDIEYQQKINYIDDQNYVKKIKNIEKKACSKSNLIFATSQEEKKNLIEVYSVNPKKVFVTPNGVDTSEIHTIKDEEKEEQKQLVDMSDRVTILFVGSWHPPNLEALKFIVDKLSKKFEKYKFLVIGSVKDYYLAEYGNLPNNILAFGVVDEEEKYEIYKLADIAINPMFSGSGTNLKMLDYMSAGIPVISTPIGARGLNIENEKHAIICSADEIPEKMVELINDKDLHTKLRINARVLAEDNYSWETIAKSIKEKLNEM